MTLPARKCHKSAKRVDHLNRNFLKNDCHFKWRIIFCGIFFFFFENSLNWSNWNKLVNCFGWFPKPILANSDLEYWIDYWIWVDFALPLIWSVPCVTVCHFDLAWENGGELYIEILHILTFLYIAVIVFVLPMLSLY